MVRSAGIYCALFLITPLCTISNVAIAQLGPGVHLFGLTYGAISLCTKPQMDQRYYVVTLHIPDAKTLLTSAPCAGGCVEHNGTPLPSYQSSQTPTLFDVNLSKTVWTDAASPKIWLHISLDDKHMTFIPDTGMITYSVRQDPADTMFECRTNPGLSVGGLAYVDVLIDAQSSIKPGSITIGINVDESVNGDSTVVLPIFVDPKVPNNG